MIDTITNFGNHIWKGISLINNRKEYEISVLKALADKYSRNIIMATISKAKSVQDLIREKDIPSTSAYRRVKFLKKNKLLKVEKIVLDEEGTKYELLRSSISDITVKFQADSIEIYIKPNRPAADRMTDIFFSMRDNE